MTILLKKVLKFRGPPSVADAVRRLLVGRGQKNLRPVTLNELRHRRGDFAETFGTRQLNEITGEDLTAGLVKQAADPVNRHDYSLCENLRVRRSRVTQRTVLHLFEAAGAMNRELGISQAAFSPAVYGVAPYPEA